MSIRSRRPAERAITPKYSAILKYISYIAHRMLSSKQKLAYVNIYISSHARHNPTAVSNRHITIDEVSDFANPDHYIYQWSTPPSGEIFLLKRRHHAVMPPAALLWKSIVQAIILYGFALESYAWRNGRTYWNLIYEASYMARCAFDIALQIRNLSVACLLLAGHVVKHAIIIVFQKYLVLATIIAYFSTEWWRRLHAII